MWMGMGMGNGNGGLELNPYLLSSSLLSSPHITSLGHFVSSRLVSFPLPSRQSRHLSLSLSSHSNPIIPSSQTAYIANSILFPFPIIQSFSIPAIPMPIVRRRRSLPNLTHPFNFRLFFSFFETSPSKPPPQPKKEIDSN